MSRFCRGLLAALLLVATVTGATAQTLSPGDRQAYRAAFAAARAAQWVKARDLAAHAKERLPAKILLWLALQHDPDVGFDALASFIDQNPSWPHLGQLRQRAEAATVLLPDPEARHYLETHPPVTAKGKLRLADLLPATGQAAAADALIREVWVTTDFSPEEETDFLMRYGARIGPADQGARLNRLLWDGQKIAVRRQLDRVTPEWRGLGEARLALAAQQEGADRLAAAVAAPLRNDAGLILDRVRWNRFWDHLDDAAFILQQPPKELVRPVAWWSERDTLVRHLLDEHKDRTAYTLAAWRGLGESGTALADAEFLAGWIALRRLDEPKPAYAAFTKLHDGVKSAISLARGGYWAGRAAEVLGEKQSAQKWLVTAASYGTTFYGQLAAARLGVAPQPNVQAPPSATPAEQAEIERNELARAARLLVELSDTDLARVFLRALERSAKTPAEHALIATLASSIGILDIGIAAARHASPDGVPPLQPGYPVLAFAHRGTAEPALVLAITRQESAFDRTAVSRSNARGLMQLLPGTAKDMARALSMPFSADRLLGDGGYNLTLGQAYLDKLLTGFGGSYVLSVAAYNAGPGRVRQWLETYGDPRGGTVDVVDWIETLPFEETRNYVQRVLENLQVYRLRLGDRHAFRLTEDLKR